MKYVCSLKWKGLFFATLCSLFVEKHQRVSACVSHSETHTNEDSIFIQASSCKKQGKENVGTSYVLLLENAILLAFHFLWSYCMSSSRLRNLICARELTFENCPNATADIVQKSHFLNNKSLIYSSWIYIIFLGLHFYL